MVLEEHRSTKDYEKEKDTNSAAYVGRSGKQSRPGRPEVGRCPVCQKLGHTKDTYWKEPPDHIPDWWQKELQTRHDNRAGALRYDSDRQAF